MTVNAYFTLENSDGSLVKRFKVIKSGYVSVVRKMQTIRETLDGELDVSTGGVYESHEYIIKVTEEVEDSNYGALEDLETFYRYNNPNSTPSNVLTMTDHRENIHDVIMDGTFSPEPLGVILEGTEAYYVVRCVFQFIPEAS
jgi:hypothetical protein